MKTGILSLCLLVSLTAVGAVAQGAQGVDILPPHEPELGYELPPQP